MARRISAPRNETSSELDEIDRHVGDFFRDALPLLHYLPARLVGRQPLEELEQLCRFDADRGGQALGVVELLPVALVAKLEHLGDRFLHQPLPKMVTVTNLNW